ncbi:glycoside hydrolase family 55 protein [Cellulomonas sp. SG140]|uniref:glycoside hydrolase family 55 protein n=1 Tax=Cellulomonas sp. SG140 TaxID=2976536 RepID=UPI0021E92340|nr:glycoside hydrolase family 55 protein [Cellulomonas sp. SG140]
MTFLGLALSTGLAAAPAVAADPHQGGSAADLGANVVVFTPSMSTADIRARAQVIYAQQSDSEMGTGRYALLFEPGTYGSASDPLDIPVGYYTEVAGLGQDPSAVTINGGVTAIGKNGSGSLDIFWRSVSNLTIHVVATADGCHTGNEMWAVSQAAPMRRVDVKDYTTFMPYCENPNYASGGFVADSFLEGGALNGSQQQFYVRNTNLGGGWSNYVWNQVFSGDVNAPAQDFGNGAAYTTLTTTPVSKEKPYLYTDTAGGWNVFVPSVQHDSVGTTWANGHTPGTSVPLNRFFVATPSDSASTINAALARGLNLLLTPGVYDVSSPIKVKRAGTVVLGLGMATLTATNGNTVLTTADVPGIDIAGITVDAGAVNSPVLVQIGTKSGNNGRPHDGAADPVALQDVFFRIGGPHVGKANLALEVNTDHAVLDDLWVWRADHGVPGSVGWTVNTADTGLVVNGDDVTATGLFVEHFQKYNVIWNGNGGKVLFFQNELPYDPPTQADYQHDGILGYAAFKVADSVSTFAGYGMGSYIYTNVNPDIHVSHAFEVPVNDGVRLHDLLTINLSGPGTIDHVVNDTGGPVSDANKDVASQVVSFP